MAGRTAKQRWLAIVFCFLGGVVFAVLTWLATHNLGLSVIVGWLAFEIRILSDMKMQKPWL